MIIALALFLIIPASCSAQKKAEPELSLIEKVQGYTLQSYEFDQDGTHVTTTLKAQPHPERGLEQPLKIIFNDITYIRIARGEYEADDGDDDPTTHAEEANITNLKKT